MSDEEILGYATNNYYVGIEFISADKVTSSCKYIIKEGEYPDWHNPMKRQIVLYSSSGKPVKALDEEGVYFIPVVYCAYSNNNWGKITNNPELEKVRKVIYSD